MPASPNRYAVVAIPLNRPQIIDFLLNRSETPRGAPLQIVGLRPTAAAELAWSNRLRAREQPNLADVLAIDQPHHYLVSTFTDRLVPVQFLNEPEFLTRNLGGWSPLYFGVVNLAAREAHPTDPLLQHAEILTDYGPAIDYFGAEPAQVAKRLPHELGTDAPEAAAAIVRLHQARQQAATDRPAYIRQLVAALHANGGAGLSAPRPLLLNELLGQLVRLEQERRAALANGDTAQAEVIASRQEQLKSDLKLHFILKGEYIAGRHRASIVLIAPELGVVIKQPAPEPFHEIALNAKNHNGRAENWPYSTESGALVTPHGRLRLVVEEGLVPRLSRVLGHRIDISTSVGLTIEAFVAGPTVQELVLADPARMTPALYEEFILRQQVCELLGGENGDWHSANFVQRDSDGRLVHIDWGAARPLRPDEHTPAGRLARLNQVQNIAYSFHNEDLARRVMQLHAELMADESRLARVRRQAQALIDAAPKN